VVALVGELAPRRQHRSHRHRLQPSRGLKKGVVVNIESTVQSIQRAVEEAELMAGCEIDSVYAGIAGSHVRSLNSHGVGRDPRPRKSTARDVDHVIDAAEGGRDPGRPAQSCTLLPQEFRTSTARKASAIPVGMSASASRPRCTSSPAPTAPRRTSVKCVQRCGLAVERRRARAACSSFAVLTDDEKELGVCIVDIGGGTTDIAVFSQRRDPPHRRDPDRRRSGRPTTSRCRCARRRSTPRTSSCATPARSRSSRTRTRRSRCPASASAPARRLARQTLAEVVEPRYRGALRADAATSCAAAASRK
jgi:cell division protein FtsA